MSKCPCYPSSQKPRKPMNTIIEQLPLPDPTLEASSTEDSPHKRLRHNSKIGRLPKADRDFINSLLDDGLTYGQIVQELRELDPPLPYPISERNLSSWQATGYQEYLRHQERLDLLAANQDVIYFAYMPISKDSL